jgi:hypothetical protein
MQLTQTAWLQRDKRGRNRLRHREVRRVDAVERATIAWDWFRVVLERAIDIGCIASQRSVAAGHVVVTDVQLGNVRVDCGNVGKDALIDAKVLCKDRFGGVSYPVAQVERHAGPESDQAFAEQQQLTQQHRSCPRRRSTNTHFRLPDPESHGPGLSGNTRYHPRPALLPGTVRSRLQRTR